MYRAEEALEERYPEEGYLEEGHLEEGSELVEAQPSEEEVINEAPEGSEVYTLSDGNREALQCDVESSQR
jgi:hypothetical protein